MNLSDQHSLTLLYDISSKDLYKALLVQLRKDFNKANLHLEIEEQITPNQVVQELYQKINSLILNNFNDYLNLLYVIDVSEKQLKKLETKDTSEMVKQVTFLILKREWQKVWFRNRYS
jgi:hypothetical protein